MNIENQGYQSILNTLKVLKENDIESDSFVKNIIKIIPRKSTSEFIEQFNNMSVEMRYSLIYIFIQTYEDNLDIKKFLTEQIKRRQELESFK